MHIYKFSSRLQVETANLLDGCVHKQKEIMVIRQKCLLKLGDHRLGVQVEILTEMRQAGKYLHSDSS